MMPEISLNILDVAENSTRAGASLVQITVDVQPDLDRLTVIIIANAAAIIPFLFLMLFSLNIEI